MHPNVVFQLNWDCYWEYKLERKNCPYTRLRRSELRVMRPNPAGVYRVVVF
jgi:hypothetical protein